MIENNLRTHYSNNILNIEYYVQPEVKYIYICSYHVSNCNSLFLIVLTNIEL